MPLYWAGDLKIAVKMFHDNNFIDCDDKKTQTRNLSSTKLLLEHFNTLDHLDFLNLSTRVLP